MLFTATAVAALVSLAVIPAARGAVHAVTVGGPGILKFDPASVTAVPGDTVLFTFKQKNHTVTQSTLENPCTPAAGGFDSGFQPVADDDTAGPFPTAQFVVQDTNPVWAFCRQGNHCQQGMVFAINPGNSLPAFQSAATGGAAAASAPPSGSGVVTVTATVTAGGQTMTTTYASAPGSAAPTTASTTEHQVTVGGPNLLTFDPASITAQIGDTITFTFKQKNHTVTQSTFSAPCRALTSTSTSGQVGFDSGFVPVPADSTDFPKFTIQVNNTSPIWAYCRQQTHCGQGMVFAVNAVESGSQSFAAFQALARQLNGTGSAPGSTTPDTNSNASGAPSILASTPLSHGVAVGVAALVLGLVL